MPRVPPVGYHDSRESPPHRPSPYLQQRFASRPVGTDHPRYNRKHSLSQASFLSQPGAPSEKEQVRSRGSSISRETEVDFVDYQTQQRESFSSAGSGSYKSAQSFLMPTKTTFYPDPTSGKTFESLTDAFTKIYAGTSPPPTPNISPLPNIFLLSKPTRTPRIFADYHSRTQEAAMSGQDAAMEDVTDKSQEPVPSTIAKGKGKAKEVQPLSEWFSPAALGLNALHLNLGRPNHPLYPHMPTMSDFLAPSKSAPWKPPATSGGPDGTDRMASPPRNMPPPPTYPGQRPMSELNSPILPPLPPSRETTPKSNSPSPPATSTKVTPKFDSPSSIPLPPSGTTPEPESPSPLSTSARSPTSPPLPPSGGRMPKSNSPSPATMSTKAMPRANSPSAIPLPPPSGTTPEPKSPSPLSTSARSPMSSPSLPSRGRTPESNFPNPPATSTKARPGFNSPSSIPLPPPSGTTPEPKSPSPLSTSARSSTSPPLSERIPKFNSPNPPSTFMKATPRSNSPSSIPLPPPSGTTPEPNFPSPHSTSARSMSEPSAAGLPQPSPSGATPKPQPRDPSRRNSTPSERMPEVPHSTGPSPQCHGSPSTESQSNGDCDGPFDLELKPLPKPAQTCRLWDTPIGNAPGAPETESDAMDIDDAAPNVSNSDGDRMNVDEDSYDDSTAFILSMKRLPKPHKSTNFSEIRSQCVSPDPLLQEFPHIHRRSTDPTAPQGGDERPSSSSKDGGRRSKDHSGRPGNDANKDAPEPDPDDTRGGSQTYSTMSDDMERAEDHNNTEAYTPRHWYEGSTPEKQSQNRHVEPSEAEEESYKTEQEASDDGIDHFSAEASTFSRYQSRATNSERGYAGQDENHPLTKNDLMNAFNVFGNVLGEHLEKGFQGLYSYLEATRNPPRPPESKFQKRKRGSFPHRRSFDTNHLAKTVRTHIDRLLGKNYLLSPMVTPEQSNIYALIWDVDGGQTCAPSCTVTDFKIDLLNGPHCPWNLSAGRVFCRSFLDFHALADDEEVISAVSAAFFTRIKTIKLKYSTTLLRKHDQEVLMRKKRRYRRKYNLYQRRLMAATTCDSLQHHVEIIKDLDIDGMSSDESDDESNEPGKPCHVSRPLWRADELATWLQVFDSAYAALTREHGSGHRPHLRIRSQFSPRMSQNKKFVRGLPRNAYKTQWLDRQGDVNISVRPHDNYLFQHKTDVFDFVEKSK